VDTNLFPAGFNNLAFTDHQRCQMLLKKALTRVAKNAERVLLVPENHTRNRYYLDNVAILQRLLRQAGYEVRIGINTSQIKHHQTLHAALGDDVYCQPLQKTDNTLYVEGFIPDIVLLNNDLSEAVPSILQQLNQPVVPPLTLGWHQRSKSKHFQFYDHVSHNFANKLGLDPWLVTPLWRYCDRIDFTNSRGLDQAGELVDELIDLLADKYRQFQINQRPFVVVKADAGTYGMAVIKVNNSQQLKSLNRKQRNRMTQSKGGRPVHSVLIQEGVTTVDTIDHQSAEPVIYTIDCQSAGGFYRHHPHRHSEDNLNVPGMAFSPIHLTQTADNADIYSYTVIARLALLAASYELNHMESCANGSTLRHCYGSY
jgi:glutamate--cysteine ligase